jgi:uncharacterized DUF497 family protein
MDFPDFSDVVGFERDQGNATKNGNKHDVTQGECEEVFFHEPMFVGPDELHSGPEARYYLLGRTNTDRHLFLVFTIRNDLIRVFSARTMIRSERHMLEDR